MHIQNENRFKNALKLNRNERRMWNYRKDEWEQRKTIFDQLWKIMKILVRKCYPFVSYSFCLIYIV